MPPPATLWPFFITALASLLGAGLIAVVTQLVIQYTYSKVQEAINRQNDVDHKDIGERMAEGNRRQDENLNKAIEGQKALISEVLTAHKETNVLLQRLISTVTEVAASNRSLSTQVEQHGSRLDFYDARLRDVEASSIAVGIISKANSSSKKVKPIQNKKY